MLGFQQHGLTKMIIKSNLISKNQIKSLINIFSMFPLYNRMRSDGSKCKIFTCKTVLLGVD